MVAHQQSLTAAQIEQFHRDGYLLVPGLIDPELLARAQRGITNDHPSPEQYFDNPDEFPRYNQSQFAGIKRFPYSDFSLNYLAISDNMINAVKALMGTDDIRMVKGEFWAKYSGAIDYDQMFHRDFGNHTLVVPRTDHRYKEVTTFIFLHDVTPDCGPTAVLRRQLTDDISFGKNRLPKNMSFDPEIEEVLATGPAGTAMFYSYDVFHRGTQIKSENTARYMVLTDYRRADAPWIDRHAWPEHGNNEYMREFIEKITPAQRCLFNIPLPGHEYWNEQTVTDMGVRYENMDMTPYREALAITG
ncbi:MAG: phytanoyl-CoA dioxygenase family protein [Pseudomonadota bacterium]